MTHNPPMNTDAQTAALRLLFGAGYGQLVMHEELRSGPAHCAGPPAHGGRCGGE